MERVKRSSVSPPFATPPTILVKHIDFKRQAAPLLTELTV